jgi:hypothetical protein
MHPSLRFLTTVALLAAVSCRSSTEPELQASAAAGLYVLESVTGRGPVSGTFLLTADGVAVRTVHYAPMGTSATELVAIGTFQLLPETISFALHEDSGRSTYVWSVSGARGSGTFNIQYPDPADGPNIIETYRRQ